MPAPSKNPPSSEPFLAQPRSKALDGREELSDARTLKTRLAGLCHVPRFRQKLLSDGKLRREFGLGGGLSLGAVRTREGPDAQQSFMKLVVILYRP